MLLLDDREVPSDSRAAIEAALALFVAVRELRLDDDVATVDGEHPLARAWFAACRRAARLERVDRPSDIRQLTRVALASAHVAAKLLDVRAHECTRSSLARASV